MRVLFWAKPLPPAKILMNQFDQPNWNSLETAGCYLAGDMHIIIYFYPQNGTAQFTWDRITVILPCPRSTGSNQENPRMRNSVFDDGYN